MIDPKNVDAETQLAHGGTTFGPWNAGTAMTLGDGDEEPDYYMKDPGFHASWTGVVHSSFVTSSYDYAAPISEQGRHGFGGDGMDKFLAIRKLLTEAGAEVVPEPPFQRLVRYGIVTLNKRAALRDPLMLQQLCDGGWRKYKGNGPRPMEWHGQQSGMVLYRCSPAADHNGTRAMVLTEGGDGHLRLKAKDRVSVWHGEELIVKLRINSRHDDFGRRFRNVTAFLKKGRVGGVDVLVESLGRHSYMDRRRFGWVDDLWLDWKGLASARIDHHALSLGNWQFCALPLSHLHSLNDSIPPGLAETTGSNAGPVFFQGEFTVPGEPADTFLHFSPGFWQSGNVYVNGVQLGRYHRKARGRFDLYLPKSMLRTGQNQIVLLEMDPPQEANASDSVILLTDQRANASSIENATSA